jgi:hypothetical protein
MWMMGAWKQLRTMADAMLAAASSAMFVLVTNKNIRYFSLQLSWRSVALSAVWH